MLQSGHLLAVVCSPLISSVQQELAGTELRLQAADQPVLRGSSLICSSSCGSQSRAVLLLQILYFQAEL